MSDDKKNGVSDGEKRALCELQRDVIVPLTPGGELALRHQITESGEHDVSIGSLSATPREGGEHVELEDHPTLQGAYVVTASEKHGPSRANSRAYVDGWDRIFGKQAVGQA